MKAKTLSPARRIARLYTRGRLPLVIRGREFGLRDLRVIVSCAAQHRLRGGQSCFAQRIFSVLPEASGSKQDPDLAKRAKRREAGRRG